jgi:hypothetical protein
MWTEVMKQSTTEPQFVICLRNQACDDLEIRKIYQVLPDEAAAADGYLRVIDESGEDYLYPAEYFMAVDFPHAVKKALLLAS